MSTIGSDTRLNPASLDLLNQQLALDDAQRGGQPQVQDTAFAELGQPLPAPAVDQGEEQLNLAAWTDDGQGERLLGDDEGLALRLSGLDRSAAVDSGVDDVVAELA